MPSNGSTVPETHDLDDLRHAAGFGTEGACDERVLSLLKKLGHRATVKALSEKLDCSEKTVRLSVSRLHAAGHALELAPDADTVLSGTSAGSRAPTVHKLTDFAGDWARFGFIGDNHLCNKHQRLDVLNAAYDLFEAEGISNVYNTGNWIDGEARFNRHELLVFGMDSQIDYLIDKYPQRKGVTTHYIAGACHEGWYQQRECVEIGRYAMLRARDAGRTDLNYLGFIEADVELQVARRPVHMKMIHPGGGAAYAVSYKGQKLIESFQGGEKPSIVLQGHYHKFNLGYPREVWCVDTGTTCDQTGFMRTKHLQAMVGFGIISIHRHPRGGVNRIRLEFLPFFDRKFYDRKFS